MMTHASFERLAITAIDFDLAQADRDALDLHLSACEACRSIERRYRSDAAALRTIALAPAPARVRAAVLGEARRRVPRRPLWQWLAVAALLAAMLAGLLVSAGALLRLEAESTEPLTWRAAPAQDAFAEPGGSLRLTRIAASGGRYVALGSGSGGPVVLVSSDGAGWLRVADDTPFRDAVTTDVAFLSEGARPNEFAIVGSRGGTPTIWWSSDGERWTPEVVEAANGSALAVTAMDDHSIVVGSREPVPVGESSGMPVHAAWYRSAAGWAPAAIGAGGPGDVGQLTAVTPAGARLIAVGDARLFASVDGGSWDPLPGDVAAGSTISVAWGGGRLLSVGNAADSAQFRLSSDGATWVDVTPQDARAARVLGLTFRDGLFVAVGGGGGGARSWLSLDGETWQVGRSIDGGTGAEMADVVWGSGSFVAVGARGTDAAIWSGEVTRP